MKASLAKWIGSCVANMGHICIKYSGSNVCSPHFPTLGAWFALQAIPCAMKQISHFYYEKHAGGIGPCSVVLLYQPPWISVWDKCLKCLSALNGFASCCKHTVRRERDLLRRGPFNLFLQRRDSIFVPANPFWLLLKSKGTQAWISCSVCKPGEEEGAAPLGPRSLNPVENY